MSLFHIEAFDIPDAWIQVVRKIHEEGGEFNIERGSELTKTKKISLSLIIEQPENRPLVHEGAPFAMKYVEQYALEYLFVGDKKEGEEYTYGERLRKPIDQIERVIERYKEFRNDRQNTMLIRQPEDINSHDPPCLTVIDTEILDDKLNFLVYFRSWDAYAGFPANVAGLQLLKEYMAERIGVGPGTTSAFSKNIHLYERQFEMVDNLIKSGANRPKFKAEKD
ncbi:MAG: thymidylate synthase [Candidatus Altiarchaeales archaeon]|nr:thymidylate synthase [Candidatus Altiarchaeota archaeon]MBU4341655.1 thymidylate synthase [Candidatus Altiarchaeota archaeon]MBU4407015.1 thymidylate synthase [Candidatus Altiarchaeota archaeon]MBU4437840.1 thymidylate synthase [Candidatus Altiarchaeota archaeon]MCG2783445.1 thymidylate synthase [Candidatus Altiarchaeales archaeon]